MVKAEWIEGSWGCITFSKKIEDVGTNVFDLLKYEKILFTKESFKAIEERLVK